MPESFEEGSYQLIAHARSNDDYEESWSDPGDRGVFGDRDGV